MADYNMEWMGSFAGEYMADREQDTATAEGGRECTRM